MADSLEAETTETYDIDAAAERIGASLGNFSSEESPAPGSAPQDLPSPAAQTPSPEPVVQGIDAPKSWKQAMHAHWAKMPREAQEYAIEREQQMLNYMRPYTDTIKPYEQMFQQLNLQPHEAIGNLLRAHQMLSSGPDEQRWQYAQDLLKRLGFEGRLNGNSTPQTPQNPDLQQLTQKLSTLEQSMLQQQQHVYNQAKAEANKQIETFAADKSHPYFDEVADELAIFITQGLSLQEAYERAVWANPAVRAKEQARTLAEEQAKWKENARLESLPKKKASSVNVKSLDSGRTPTEPLGSIDDTIKSVHQAIRARAS